MARLTRECKARLGASDKAFLVGALPHMILAKDLWESHIAYHRTMLGKDLLAPAMNFLAGTCECKKLRRPTPKQYDHVLCPTKSEFSVAQKTTC